MDNIEKLVEKIRQAPNNVNFETLEKILFGIGFVCNKKNKGSHNVFRKSGFDHINIPKHKPIKPHYVKKVIKAFDDYKANL